MKTSRSKRVMRLIPLLFPFLLAGCVSTIVEEPALSNSAIGPDDIVITLTGDAITSPGSLTRDDEADAGDQSGDENDADAGTGSETEVVDIHAGHQLRYTAKLYKVVNGKDINPTGEDHEIQVVEKLASEGSQIVFKQVKKGSYFVTVFADYIKGDAVATDGHYPDLYYTTSSAVAKVDVIQCKVTSAELFNNHNLDCFVVHSGVITKEEGTGYEMKKTLKRAVSRVEVRSTDGNRANLEGIEISSFKPINDYQYVGDIGSKADKALTKFTISKIDDENQPLFFFYSFGLDSGAQLDKFTFSLTPVSGKTFVKSKWDVEGVGSEANTIYKLQGKLLTLDASSTPDDNTPDDNPDNPDDSDNPVTPETPAVENDDIAVSLSLSSEGWTTKEISTEEE